jgi:putative tryptophan/tyrosine transport system substrate-binding protein
MKRREFIASLLFSAVTPRVQAQQPAKVYRIAVVHPSASVKVMSETGSFRTYKAFFAELRRLGYVEGQNLSVERYSGEGKIAHYAELAREVVRQQPDLIFASTSRMVLRLKEATATIPIVGTMADPVAWGIVDSLARPGGNITGVSEVEGEEIIGKRLGLLRELIPTASRVGFLASRDIAESVHGVEMREAARQSGISLVGPPLETIQEAEYRRVFELMKQERADALIVSSQGEHGTYSRLIIELVEQSRLPTIFDGRFFAEQGGLIAYGTDGADIYRRAADYVARILQGVKPSELPIELATKFELVINLKAAKTLGLTVPQILLAGADVVIE